MNLNGSIMRYFIDIKDMPNYNNTVKNGIDSISTNKININKISKIRYPHCVTHGAMLKVASEGIWRCGENKCNTGCFQTNLYRFLVFKIKTKVNQ